MSITAWIVAFVLAFTVGAGTGMKWEKGQQAMREMKAAQQSHDEHVRAEKQVDTAAVGFEKDKTVVREKFVVITERIEDAKQTDFYAAGTPACFDPDGVRIVNDSARPAASAASQPARALPGASAPAQRRAGDSAGRDAALGTDVRRVSRQAPSHGGGLAQMNQRLGLIPRQQRSAVVVRSSGDVSFAIQLPAAHVGGT